MGFLTDTPQGAVLNLRISPRAHQNAIQGEHGDALKIRLCAPPVEGAANAALTSFLADALSVPRSQVQLLSGAASRSKRVRIVGHTAAAIQAKLS
ncbi:MAG: DUF167 domain-containing protein [Verrucomicrobiota bacterium]|nr:DUF167 domain-containing protein [Verrucomicrobiota bacterium]